ncbi:MAG TPA: asparagine synthase-related protein [Candidatus Sulfotelmatobacter sp.]|nr:asparagine synthase-related protein [Candidatus Sulfotelmatobacter sp.]
MSAILIVRDPDVGRRELGLRAAEAAMRRFDLAIGSGGRGPVAMRWGTFAGAPVSQAPGALVIGDLIPGPGAERLAAAEYAARAAREATPPACDGYYFAATFDALGALTIAADILGAFPVYYAGAGEALLVASSPALIRYYPGVTSALDHAGLAALLITNGSVGGRTLYKGIRRLPAGVVLIATPGSPPRERRHYAIELSGASHDQPVQECAARFHEALSDSARRHVPAGVPHTLLLSGGIDSRMIAGVLARQGIPLRAVTRGLVSDLEYFCARAVAKQLRLPHQRIADRNATFAEFERLLEWEGLACGPDTANVELDEAVPWEHPHFVSGHMADPILGGVTVGKAFDRGSRTTSFEHYLKVTNAWGVPLDALPRLLRRDVFGDSVHLIIQELRQDFTCAADHDLARSWLHTMGLKERFAIGGMLNRLAFRSWPRSPQVDRRLLAVAAGMPLALLDGRRLQREMLIRFHPELARLPLDHNDPDVTPLLPGIYDLVRAGLDRRLRRLRGRLRLPNPERRYYFRTYDFEGAGWRALRQAAEPDRERALALFDRDAFEALVPRAGQRTPPVSRLEDASAAKLLLGVSVWLRVGLG